MKLLEQRVEKLESEAKKVESARALTAMMREVKKAYEILKVQVQVTKGRFDNGDGGVIHLKARRGLRDKVNISATWPSRSTRWGGAGRQTPG